ncbi:hypothetical protein AB0F64_12645 [Streptomyces sp. NPDC026294]|uniref:hypothetical protein n=1 Tax=Streptomyces sp. NPDC026294 TaxID=3155362 RepID=UPI00340E766A
MDDLDTPPGRATGRRLDHGTSRILDHITSHNTGPCGSGDLVLTSPPGPSPTPDA